MTFLHFDTDNTDRTWTDVTAIATEQQGYIIAEGERVIESFHGRRHIAVPTGRTRQFWGVTCDTYDRHDIITTASGNTIIGIKGDKIIGGRVAIRRN